MQSILVVEDEIYLSRFIELELQHEGYNVTVANDGLEGYNLAIKNNYNLILLDLMLPSMNGLDFCRKFREKFQTPIIMLTAKEEILDKVTGLDLGANDYMTKPFSIEEVLARIRVCLRNTATPQKEESKEVIVNELSLNPATFLVYKGDEQIIFTKKEFLLLQVLMENKNEVQTREKLLQAVWNETQHEDSNVVDVFVRYVRNKLSEKGLSKFITTIRGIGYVVRET